MRNNFEDNNWISTRVYGKSVNMVFLTSLNFFFFIFETSRLKKEKKNLIEGKFYFWNVN